VVAVGLLTGIQRHECPAALARRPLGVAACWRALGNWARERWRLAGWWISFDLCRIRFPLFQPGPMWQSPTGGALLPSEFREGQPRRAGVDEGWNKGLSRGSRRRGRCSDVFQPGSGQPPITFHGRLYRIGLRQPAWRSAIDHPR